VKHPDQNYIILVRILGGCCESCACICCAALAAYRDYVTLKYVSAFVPAFKQHLAAVLASFALSHLLSLDVMTENDCGGRRASKRQCARRSGAVPSAVHYVGYVEDDETPASIARKFEELDRIQAASRATAGSAVSADPNQHSTHAVLAPDDGSLTEEQLMEVSQLQAVALQVSVLMTTPVTQCNFSELCMVE